MYSSHRKLKKDRKREGITDKCPHPAHSFYKRKTSYKMSNNMNYRGGYHLFHTSSTHPGTFIKCAIKKANHKKTRADLLTQTTHSGTAGWKSTKVPFENVCADTFQVLVQTHRCDGYRKSLIRLDLFTLFFGRETHLESLPPSHSHLSFTSHLLTKL